ncbi:MAG: hypothetical protein WC979_02345 [Candidatus Pacearchaeota archaeon]|jgi:hypothetical protein|nr:hypothetical protein [Clostridia bacterium]
MENLIAKIESFGLKNISTEKQKANGTYMFQEIDNPKERVGIYLKSGYIRRIMPGYFGTAMYQLNPVTNEITVYGTKVSRILFPNDTEKLFGLIIKRYEKKLQKLKKS